ncbi:hypothetical protein BJ741DRAFT_672688 [Chytriomyces cf. hyalinus JEL632]|nr:hypothetical protein BJ741DRAFT_672688 [Chytriomyces cf. hyalinus JEL632]
MSRYVSRYADLGTFEDRFVLLMVKGCDDSPKKVKSPKSDVVTRAIERAVSYLMTGTKVHDTRSPHVVAEAIANNTETFHTLIQKTGACKERIDIAAALICLVLTKMPYPKYQYGLANKLPLPNFKATNDLTWVWVENQKDFAGWISSRIRASEEPTPPQPEHKNDSIVLYNATAVSVMDFKGCHHSGWEYVVATLMKYHDTGVIPFRKPWCGFIHHTFDSEYSEHNLEVLFETPTFLESLKQYKYLFTLSKYLRAQIEKRLDKLGNGHIVVSDFIHPTEMCDLPFSMDKFQANHTRKLVQIGHAVLRGGNMENYFKPGDFSLTAHADSIDCKSIPTLDITDKVIEKIKFVSGLLDYTLRGILSVEVISRLDNDEYDKLLSENIVFLKLVDASAVNTVIECIVRNTPVLVNRHPAVVEMLGTEYPFYYQKMDGNEFESTNGVQFTPGRRKILSDRGCGEPDD